MPDSKLAASVLCASLCPSRPIDTTEPASKPRAAGVLIRCGRKVGPRVLLTPQVENISDVAFSPPRFKLATTSSFLDFLLDLVPARQRTGGEPAQCDMPAWLSYLAFLLILTVLLGFGACLLCGACIQARIAIHARRAGLEFFFGWLAGSIGDER